MKLKHSWLLAIFTVSVMTGCGGDKDKKKDPHSLASYKGFWVKEGTGLGFNIDKEKVSVYHYTKETCSVGSEYFEVPLKEAEEMFTSIQPESKIVRKNKNKLVVKVKAFSYLAKGDVEFNRVTMVKKKFPAQCKNAGVSADFDPEFMFEHAWHALNDYYPFFAHRNVDWQAQWNTYRSQVNADTTQLEFLEVMDEMMSPLKDDHVSISVETDELSGEFSAGQFQGWNLHAATHSGGDASDQEEMYQRFALRVISNIETYYGHTENEEVVPFVYPEDGEALIIWGRLNGNIGYINIGSMSVESIDDTELSLSDQVDMVHEQMQKALDDLQGTDSLIMDIRFNGGGIDAISLAIASYFTNEERHVYGKQNYSEGILSDIEKVYVKPNSEASYLKPVTLITGPDTASAAEIFTMAMLEFPNVKQIGETTQGIFSDTASFELMPGWELSVSHQIVYSKENKVFETIGLSPEKAVPVTSASGSFAFSIQPAIHEALLDYGVDLELSKEDFESSAAELLETVGIPAVSVAWIGDNGIIDSIAYGYSNVEQQEENTVDRPFNIGSVSKTFIGTSAMQMVERGLVSLDTSLADLAMSAIMDSPYVDSSEVTLLHLATHTSGVADISSTYDCAYYVEDPLVYFYSLFIDSLDCPDPVETNQNAFIHSLLSSSGELYRQQHFLDIELGEERRYSNVGSALAAELLSTASGVDFKDWTQQNIFDALEMNSTHWFNADFNPEELAPAKRYLFIDEELTEVPEYALATWADGGLKASVIDLATYLHAVTSGGEVNGKRILDTNTVDQMLLPISHISSIEGQAIFWTNDGFLLGHGGADPGARTEMRYDQYNKMGFVIMLNLSTEGMDDVTEAQFNHMVRILNQLVYLRGLTLVKQ